jgi:gluconolactonase
MISGRLSRTRSLCVAALAVVGCGGQTGPTADTGIEESADAAAVVHDARPSPPDLSADGASADAAVLPDGAPPEASADSAAPPSAPGPAGAACPAGATFGNPLPADLAVTMVRGGFGVTEGPVWLAAQKALYFSEFEGANRIHKYTPADDKLVVFADKVGVNGLTMDEKGMILAASQDMQRVTRFDPVTGARSQLAGADRYMGKPFNAVNDVIARADGNIYFSDPTFMQNNRPGQGVTAVYRLWNGEVTRIATGKQPNALHISLDGKWLYVTSSGGEPVRRFALNADGSTGAEGTPIAVPSESLALDCAGNLYLSSDGKVRVYTADGKPLGTFANITAGITNLAFGDEDLRTLYITARAALYKVRLEVPGLWQPRCSTGGRCPGATTRRSSCSGKVTGCRKQS